ncbi:MAG: glycosyltransferase family 4 protein [Methylococcales bacterium]|jgi:glycosyltransferase involved in cell wall biosynthesis|nr:glycosyltransferase family 4 protein [Methylococcales bacterium]
MIKTLHVDVEGGWGGSSRSLYELVSNIDKNKVQPHIICRKTGPIQARYHEFGISTLIESRLYSFVPRRKNSWKIFIASFIQLLKFPAGYRIVKKYIQKNNIQLVHINYDGLFLLGYFIKKRFNIPVIIHIRTQLPNNLYAKVMVRFICRFAAHIFFISDNEREAFMAHAKEDMENTSILWNISSAKPKELAFDQRQSIVYFGNIDSVKGVDRLFDLAEALRDLDVNNIKIEVYGAARNSAEFVASLEGRAKSLGLKNIQLMGHTANPEEILATAFLLCRPSRWNDPWGRDVIEATCAGIPCLVTGEYEGVIEHGKNGYLMPEFDAAGGAQYVKSLVDDPSLWQGMREFALAKADRTFRGESQAKKVGEIVEHLVAG